MRWLMTEQLNDKKYLWLYLSLVLNFVFAFIVGIYTYFDGINYDQNSPILRLQMVIISVFSLLYFFSLVSSFVSYFVNKGKKKSFFSLYILLMLALSIGSMFLSKVTVKVDPDTFDIHANVAPFFLLFVPVLILVKFYLHRFVFMDIIRTRKENEMPIHLQDMFFDKKKLETSTTFTMNMRTMLWVIIWTSMCVSGTFLCCFGIDFQNALLASCLSIGFVICILMTTSYLFFSDQKKGLLSSSLPLLVFTVLSLLVVLSCYLANVFLKKTLGQDMIPVSLSMKMIAPVAFCMLLMILSFLPTIFKAMKKNTENKKLQQKEKDCFNK